MLFVARRTAHFEKPSPHTVLPISIYVHVAMRTRDNGHCRAVCLVLAGKRVQRLLLGQMLVRWFLMLEVPASTPTDDGVFLPPFSKRSDSHGRYSSAIKMPCN